MFKLSRLIRGCLLVAIMAVLLALFWDGSPQTQGAGEGAISAGQGHTCALTDTGGVRCWGEGSFGELGGGLNPPSTSLPPVDVVGLAGGVAAISVGDFHTCAVLYSGGVKCWGLNDIGQLGVTTGTCVSTFPCTSTPLEVTGLASGYVDVAAGSDHSCALSSSGAVKCWGANSLGQLGVETTETCGSAPCRTTPVDVEGLGSGVVQITAGGFHTCARMVDGGLKCWGRNLDGQLGNADGGSGADSTTPVDVVGNDVYVDVSAGLRHTCGVTTTTKANCWGRGVSGQLGTGGTTDRFLPTPVAGLSAGALRVSAGSTHTCAVTAEGGIKCWGHSPLGGLGTGVEDNDSLVPVDVVGLNGSASAVAAGQRHSCAFLSTGTIQCWGTGSALGTAAPDTCQGTPNICALSAVKLAEAWLLDFDADGDGCLNKIELTTDETLGGLRDPNNPYDFYDVLGAGGGPPDGIIDLPNDILGVIQHFAPLGTEPEYDVQFDRGPSAGPNPWNMTAPDGVIDLPNDILGVILQFGHNCQ